MAKILIIEDDPMVSDMLRDCLEGDNHTVELVSTVADGIDRLRFYDYEMVVLDWELPDGSGVDLLQSYRSSGGAIPVLMLTARQTLDDKESGLDSGADDYLTKPFQIREFTARVRALLRRPAAIHDTSKSFHGFVLDFREHCLIRGEKKIPLLPKELAILEFLLRHPNQYVSPEQLLNSVWHSESDSTIEALRTCISRLRQKIDNGDSPSLISSSRGLGYRLDI